jgi:hypothetical protein
MENQKGGDISGEHITNKAANVRTYDAELWRVRINVHISSAIQTTW